MYVYVYECCSQHICVLYFVPMALIYPSSSLRNNRDMWGLYSSISPNDGAVTVCVVHVRRIKRDGVERE